MGNVDVNKLAEQVQLLSDIEAIKLLKYQYARGCEQAMMEGNNKPVLATLTQDAVWDGGDFGHYEGLDQLDQFFSGLNATFTFTWHFFTNPMIEVAGNTAKARWYMLAFYTQTEDGQDLIAITIEDDKYEKIDGKWLISEVLLIPGVMAPFKEGWSSLVMGQK